MTNPSDFVRDWVIRDSQNQLTRYLSPGDKISIVEHRRAHPPGVYYTLEREGTSPLDALTLFPRGHEAVRWPHKPLPRGHAPWNDDLKNLQVALQVKARRLEGEFRDANETVAVMLWIVEDAIEDKGSRLPLLVIDIRLDLKNLWQPASTIGESGTGTGDPK